MPIPHLLRKRVVSQPIVPADLSAAHGTAGVRPAQPPPSATRTQKVGAIGRIMNGLFGMGDPRDNASAQVAVPPKQAFYHYTEGDLFTPGTGNYVFELTTELPLQTVWGSAFLRRPNTFNPEQPPQVYARPTVVVNGLGGLVAGQLATQGLESDGE